MWSPSRSGGDGGAGRAPDEPEGVGSRRGARQAALRAPPSPMNAELLVEATTASACARVRLDAGDSICMAV